MECEYLFLPESNVVIAESMSALELSDHKPITRPRRPPAPPFRHNGLHDVEATWWCGVYLFFFNRLEDAEEANDQITARQAATSIVFQDVPESARHLTYLANSRLVHLTNEKKLQDCFSLLTWESREEFEGAITGMLYAPKIIVKAYRAFEERLMSNKKPPVKVQFKSDHCDVDVYDIVKYVFNIAQISFAGKDIVPARTTPVDPPVMLL